MRRLLRLCPPDVSIDDLSTVPAHSWPAFAEMRRTVATFSNVAGYIEHHGVDSSLATLLKGRRVAVTQATSVEARQELAYDILAARDAISSTLARVQIVKSVAPGVLEAARLGPESGELVSRLIKAQLIPDDAAAFSSTLMVDWHTMETTIKHSKAFKDFVTPTLLPIQWVPQLVRSTAIPLEHKMPVVTSLNAYLATATPRQAQEIASALVQEGWRIPKTLMVGLLTARAYPFQVINLLAHHGDRIPLEDAREVLRSMGGLYERVADGGTGWPNFVNNRAHRTVLERFVGDTVKRVQEQEFKRKGSRLVAQLM